MRHAAVLLTPILLLACRADRITTIDSPITASSPYAWSGGTVDLTSAAFAGPDSLPRVLVGADTLPTSRVDSFVVRVALPDTTGPIMLRVLFHDGRSLPAASVTVMGFDHWYEGAALSGNPVRVPGSTQLLGNGAHGLVRFDLRLTTAVAALPDSANEPSCSYAPGLSVVPGVVTGSRHPIPPLPYGVCKSYAWQVSPSLALVDSAPLYGAWAAVHLGPGRWIFNTKHTTYFYNGLNTISLGALEEPEQLEVSPDGSRVFPELGYDREGAPVYDAARGVIAYRLPRLYYINGVGFSATGDTAYVVGVGPPAWPDTLLILAVDPLSGAVFREGRLPMGFPQLMAVDPVQPWLYMADAVADGLQPYPVAVRVIDRRTLAQVAVLRAPVGTPGIWLGELMLPVLSPAEHRLYVVGVMNWNAPASIPSNVYVFDLIP